MRYGPEKKTKPCCLIACRVFKPAIESLELEKRYPDITVTYLPSRLHLAPRALRNRLAKQIASARRTSERVVCLYGECFPEIDRFCKQRGVEKVPGHYCYEMLLGSERFNKLLDETVGTYFAEQDLILNFQEYCVKPLELDDEDMKKCYFGQYRRLLYVRQPSDPDLSPEAGHVARLLGLSLEVRDVDYSYLREDLARLL
ncbi:MAG: DUF1638 domain-containing protein [Dehalococcoidia bacterium]|nr:DUF1638 domain-containing protein [Dehalococcoidia bacterium]